MLSLGWSALQQEHFDQSMDWSDIAYKRALAIDAENIAQTALGNEGWAYYKLGEPEKALGLFIDARQRAHNIGATTYEVNWLTTAGYVYLDADQYDKAEQYYKQALELAQQTNKQDVIDALVSLALVSERRASWIKPATMPTRPSPSFRRMATASTCSIPCSLKATSLRVCTTRSRQKRSIARLSMTQRATSF